MWFPSLPPEILERLTTWPLGLVRLYFHANHGSRERSQHSPKGGGLGVGAQKARPVTSRATGHHQRWSTPPT